MCAQSYAKLPNGQLVPVDDDGYITTYIEMSLSSFVDRDLEGVLDEISILATGSELLSDIAYSVVGHRSNDLKLKVRGSIESIDDAESISSDDLPLREFEAVVTRIGYGVRTVRLSAKTADDAMDIADDDAGNHLYPEHASEYQVEILVVAAEG